MNWLAARCLVFLATGLFCSHSFAQPNGSSDKPTRLILKDGSELIGKIISEDSVTINFATIGEISITVPREQVKSREFLSGHIIDGKYLSRDPNVTRLLFAPTARSLKSGQAYFSIYQIFFPFVAVGFTDIVTLAGGLSLLPGANAQLIYLAPKVTPYNDDRFGVACGAIYVNSTGGGGDGVGILYGVGTYGTQKAALTFGLGWGFSGSDLADRPVIVIGGELRISNSVKLISENWIPPGSDVVLGSFGFRFFGENLAADLGFIRPLGTKMGGFPFIPWVGFAYNFGTR